MRSDPIDRILSSYLELPIRASWEGSAADSIRGSFQEPRLELDGLASSWLPLERVEFSADHARFTPGVPPRIEVEGPRLAISVGQSAVDDWVRRFRMPFRLRLGERGLQLETKVAGFPVGEIETKLEVVGGWFVLQPRRASILGVPNYVATLFRSYLPLPPLPSDARLLRIDHCPEEVQLTFAVDDFEETITPGLMDRLQARLLPWSR